MRVFKQFPNKKNCPICNTSEDKECVLIAIDGTQEGFSYEAECFHLDCIDLLYYIDNGIIAQKIRKK